MSIAAVIVDPGSREAIRGQTHAVDRVLDGDVCQGLGRAFDDGHEWIWALDAAAVPEADALERLLAAARDDDTSPWLLASLVLDPGGRPVESLIARGHETYRDWVFRSVQRRRLPIRRASLAGLLVHRDAIARHGVPQHGRYGSDAAAEWTARVLREATGYLVPHSAVVVEPPPRPPEGLAALRDVPATMRMAASGAWTLGETVKAVFGLTRRAAARSGGLHRS